MAHRFRVSRAFSAAAFGSLHAFALAGASPEAGGSGGSSAAPAAEQAAAGDGGAGAVATGSVSPALQALAGESWTVKRVGGDMKAQATWDEKRGWLFERSRIDTPLPEGYPPPTPPGAIELKKYPSVRRAEVADRGDPRSNSGFWPLFRHIQRSNIEMTSPVEMDYGGLAESGSIQTWTMSFLYRTPELREPGVDTKGSRPVTIRDTEPVTVLSFGDRGSYETERVRERFAVLEGWLKDNPQWERAGEYRAFFYNDPSVRNSRKWLEVQVPVRPARGAQAPAPAAP